MKKIKIKNAKLKNILDERGKVLTEARKLTKEIEKKQQEQVRLGYKMERLKDKTVPLVDKEKIELGEYEYIARLFIEKGNVYAEIKNKIEDYKKMLKEKKE